MRIGDQFYLKLSTRHASVSLAALYEWNATARVIHSQGGEATICRQSELLTAEQYEAALKAARKEAYDKDLPVRRLEAKRRLADAIERWEAGDRTTADMLKHIASPNPRSLGKRIASAKRWGFIK